jgi:hypothetical protein
VVGSSDNKLSIFDGMTYPNYQGSIAKLDTYDCCFMMKCFYIFMNFCDEVYEVPAEQLEQSLMSIDDCTRGDTGTVVCRAIHDQTFADGVSVEIKANFTPR